MADLVMEKPKIGIVMSTTREGRFGEVPARWILDLRDYPLPMLGETDSIGARR